MNNDLIDDVFQPSKLNFAGFGQRLVAYLIDIVPIIIILNFVAYFVFGINPMQRSESVIIIRGLEFEEFRILRIMVRYISFIVWIVYCAFMEASKYRGTLGKRMLGITVIDETGSPPSLATSMIRNLTKIISYLVLALGFLWVVFHKEKRAWHDIIARTFVVKT